MIEEIDKLTARHADLNWLFRETMAKYTTFATGGMAYAFLQAETLKELQSVIADIVQLKVPFVLIGEGSNILFPDSGFDGVVISTVKLNKISLDNEFLTAWCGATVKSCCESALDNSLSGLEFIYGMPGTIGGAVWMNARCYGSEIADTLHEVEYLTPGGEVKTMRAPFAGFAYKMSPFQKAGTIILKATLKLNSGDKADISALMNSHYDDRKDKGHFDFPCAGSVFKNNREFGAPTGQLLDQLGLRGVTCGNAQIAPFHANIIINNGGATSADIVHLINLAQNEAREKLGIDLEPEVIIL